jgi:hypothetical protein
VAVVEYAAAVVAAAVVTIVLLAQRHGRGPFGEWKACAWWSAICLVDGLVAALCLAGVFGVKAAALHGTSGFARAVSIGLLGPLGLRSPVGKRRIRGRVESVGPTFIYDAARVPMEQALDERMTRLKRGDRNRWAKALADQGWDSNSFANRIAEHLEELDNREERDLERIREQLQSALTMPDEPRKMKALINVAMKEHFSFVLQDCSERPPTKEDQRPAVQQSGS